MTTHCHQPGTHVLVSYNSATGLYHYTVEFEGPRCEDTALELAKSTNGWMSRDDDNFSVSYTIHYRVNGDGSPWASVDATKTEHYSEDVKRFHTLVDEARAQLKYASQKNAVEARAPIADALKMLKKAVAMMGERNA